MKKLLGILVISLLLSVNAFAGNKFSDWLNSFGLSKPIVQDKIFYMGISYDGKPNKLLNIFAILISMINTDVYSEDKRYLLASACRARECNSSKGLIWIDTKDEKSIGLIKHSFWDELDYEDNQILIFSSDYLELPSEFISSVSAWMKKNEIVPSKVRFIGTDNSIKEFPNTFK